MEYIVYDRQQVETRPALGPKGLAFYRQMSIHFVGYHCLLKQDYLESQFMIFSISMGSLTIIIMEQVEHRRT